MSEVKVALVWPRVEQREAIRTFSRVREAVREPAAFDRDHGRSRLFDVRHGMHRGKSRPSREADTSLLLLPVYSETSFVF